MKKKGEKIDVRSNYFFRRPLNSVRQLSGWYCNQKFCSCNLWLHCTDTFKERHERERETTLRDTELTGNDCNKCLLWKITTFAFDNLFAMAKRTSGSFCSTHPKKCFKIERYLIKIAHTTYLVPFEPPIIKSNVYNEQRVLIFIREKPWSQNPKDNWFVNCFRVQPIWMINDDLCLLAKNFDSN